MSDQPALWLKILTTKTPTPQSPDPLLAAEDPESRAAIEHYLHLADRVLNAAAPVNEEEQQEDKAA
jgi:hypothetical protein